GILYNGNSHASIAGDRLRIVGKHAESATYTPDGTTDAQLDNDGSVSVTVPTFAARTIAFTTLEPLDIENMLSATIFLPKGDDIVNMDNGQTSVSGTEAIVVSGTSGTVQFESVALRGNTNVTIDTRTVDGNDTINLNSATVDHQNKNLTVLTGSG